MKQLSLSIPKPCHENREAMTPEDKGRFCGACQKTVIDFTSMSDREVAQFFKKPAGSVCGRFDDSQLNRVVEMPRKRLPWIKYFFSIALPALLFSKRATAQGEVRRITGRVDAAAVCKKPLTGAVATVAPKELKSDTVKPEGFEPDFLSLKMTAAALKTFTGHITNEKGEPVPFATVAAKKEGRVLAADSTGTFSISYYDLPLLIEVSSIGYQARAYVFTGEDSASLVLQTAVYSYETLGIVITTTVRKKKSPVPLIQSSKTDVAFTKFSVYPNPVNAGGTLTIDPKNLEAGKYTMALVAANGNVIQSGTVVFEKEKTKQTITLQSLPAGVYFVRLSNSENTKSFTEKIVVQ